VRSSNSLPDTHNTGGWTTSDPANILIVTQPVVDSSDDFIYDTATGYPYQNEIVYFGDNSENVMYRRLLANSGATGNASTSTCPATVSGCPPDTTLVENLDNLLFEFYDNNNDVTTIPEDARSVEITVNLKKQVYGRDLTVTNTARVTLRNEK
jgi:hypothetical protein